MLKINVLSFLLLLICAYQIFAEELSISRQKCKEYSEKVKSCNPPKDQVVEYGQFPHIVALGYREDEDYWGCSGILISDQYILAPAFCKFSKERKLVIKAKLGVLQLTSSSSENHTQIVKISEVVKHPENKLPDKYNDISLMKLEHPVEINEYVRPACLPVNQNEDKYIITGWETFDKEPKTYLTTYNDIYELSHQECYITFGNNTHRLKHGIDDETHLCGNPENITCKMLGGSPLQSIDKELICMFNIHAFHSFGRDCGKAKSSVFTKVFPYISWIESIVWP